jgi:hypothetical protein
MNGRRVRAVSVKNYPRRLVMARELIKEMDRSDFAIRLGMINPDEADSKTQDVGHDVAKEVVTM